MKLKDVKQIAFPKPSFTDWEEAAKAGLKGKPLDVLHTETCEGIRLKPLYTEEDIDPSSKDEVPGEFPFTRGIYRNGYLEAPWLICQQVSGRDAREANRNMREALMRGQNSVSYPVEMLTDEEMLPILMAGLDLEASPLFIDTKQLQLFVLPGLEANSEKPLQGVLAEDPAAEWAHNGQVPADTASYFDEWFAFLKQAAERLPSLRTVLIKGSSYHNAGAHAVQEIAYALSTAALYLQEGLARGMKPGRLAGKMVFSFAADSNFFLSIAKIRAARRLWAQMAAAFDAEPEAFRMHIHAVTSGLSETVYDEHVNILRTANQAFAAAAGGIQYLEIHPFTHASGKEDKLAERVARNTHLILQEETQLTVTADPAGGSWYVEALTDQLAEKAWAKFLEMDGAGGMLELLKQGRIQQETAEAAEKRMARIRSRRDSLIGTNVYPNPAEEASPAGPARGDAYFMNIEFKEIMPLEPVRLAEPFELLRQRSAAFRQTGGKTAVGLIGIGPLKSYKARADFVAAFAAAGGLESVQSPACTSPEEAAAFVRESGLDVFCLCGTDADYEQSGLDILRELKRRYPKTAIYTAGKQKEAAEKAFLDAGTAGFIHIKTDAAAMLDELQKQIGVK